MLPLKIVCFGDSLTLGYLSPTRDLPFPEHIPYGTYLQEWLGGKGDVDIRGVCGETTQDMRTRFQSQVLDPLPQVVIILGGTNDLGVNLPSVTIFENLQFFYEAAQARGILPVAVTIPSLREDSWQDDASVDAHVMGGMTPAMQQAISLRVNLNQQIQEFSFQIKIPVIDWFAETCDPTTQALALEYSNDGLHLTTAGYRKLAELLWTQVLENLVKK